MIQLIEGDISDQLGYEVTVYDDHGYRFLDDGQFAGQFFPVISKKELQQEDAYYDNLPERTDVEDQ